MTEVAAIPHERAVLFKQKLADACIIGVTQMPGSEIEQPQLDGYHNDPNLLVADMMKRAESSGEPSDLQEQRVLASEILKLTGHSVPEDWNLPKNQRAMVRNDEKLIVINTADIQASTNAGQTLGFRVELQTANIQLNNLDGMYLYAVRERHLNPADAIALMKSVVAQMPDLIDRLNTQWQPPAGRALAPERERPPSPATAAAPLVAPPSPAPALRAEPIRTAEPAPAISRDKTLSNIHAGLNARIQETGEGQVNIRSLRAAWNLDQATLANPYLTEEIGLTCEFDALLLNGGMLTDAQGRIIYIEGTNAGIRQQAEILDRIQRHEAERTAIARNFQRYRRQQGITDQIYQNRYIPLVEIQDTLHGAEIGFNATVFLNNLNVATPVQRLGMVRLLTPFDPTLNYNQVADIITAELNKISTPAQREQIQTLQKQERRNQDDKVPLEQRYRELNGENYNAMDKPKHDRVRMIARMASALTIPDARDIDTQLAHLRNLMQMNRLQEAEALRNRINARINMPERARQLIARMGLDETTFRRLGLDGMEAVYSGSAVINGRVLTREQTERQVETIRNNPSNYREYLDSRDYPLALSTTDASTVLADTITAVLTNPETDDDLAALTGGQLSMAKTGFQRLNHLTISTNNAGNIASLRLSLTGQPGRSPEYNLRVSNDAGGSLQLQFPDALSANFFPTTDRELIRLLPQLIQRHLNRALKLKEITGIQAAGDGILVSARPKTA